MIAKIQNEGLDPAVLGLGGTSPTAQAAPSGGGSVSSPPPTASDVPAEYVKFQKMLKMHVPQQVGDRRKRERGGGLLLFVGVCWFVMVLSCLLLVFVVCVCFVVVFVVFVVFVAFQFVLFLLFCVFLWFCCY